MDRCQISATDIACRRGERLLFRRLSLALESGMALQISGHNGLGKSSLLRILAGLLPPFHGTVTRTGAIGLLDEHPALDENLPLAKALDFWRAIDGGDTEIAPMPGVEALMDIPLRFLSTGQRKRAALTRLFGQRAPIWLLDEPLNGLDTAAIAACVAVVEDHCRAGGIAIIASHQPFPVAGLQILPLADFAP